MSLCVIITPTAATDILEARNWYETQQVGVGDQFYFSFRNRVAEALRAPFQPHAWGHRGIRMPKYPYSIYYEIIDEELRIIAVIHGARNPKYINQRLR
jgi:plasmid stabilization system protein ParE